GYPKLQVVQVLLLVVQVRADDLVSAGGCTLPAVVVLFLLVVHTIGLVPTGGYAVPAANVWYALTHRPTVTFNYLVKQFWSTATVRTLETTDPSPRPTFDFTAKLFSNMKLNWDGPHMPLLAPMLVPPVREHTPMREPSPVREPTPVRDTSPRPEQEPTPESPCPPSPPPSSAAVGPTTSSRPPSPSMHPFVSKDIHEGGDATTTKQEFDLAALHTLASATLGDDSSATAAGPDAETTMPLKEELAKKIHDKQEAKFAKQQDELAQKAQAESKHLERSNLLNFRRSTFHPKPTLDAPPTKRATQRAPPVPDVSSQDPAGVPAAPSIPVDVSLPAATSFSHADILVPAVSIAHVAVFVHAEPMVHPAESHMDDPLTSPEHASFEPTVDAPPSSSSCHRRKHIAKKRVTPIVDVADAAMIKFDSDSDDDPLPYAPYAGWEMVPSPLGSVHAYHNMAGHTKHFTTLREILHMSLDDADALHFWRNQDSWRIRSWRLYPRAQVHVLEIVDGRIIHMFVDVSYPLSVGTLERMLKHGLEVSKLLVRGDLTMAEQLIVFIKAALLNAKSTD
nr:hypothetical protein [Tanacetum cinerariifolium]